MLVQIRQSPCPFSGDTARFRLGIGRKRAGSIEPLSNLERAQQWRTRSRANQTAGKTFPIIVEKM